MKRHSLTAHALVGLALLVAQGCSGGPESSGTLGERKRQAEAALTDGSEPAAPPEQLLSESGKAPDTAMEGLESGDEPAPAEATPKKGSKKKAQKAAAEAADEVASGSDGGDSREAKLLQELRKDKTLRQQESEFRTQRGAELFKQNRLEEAAAELQAAVDGDPLNLDARELLNRVKIVQGDRGGELGTTATEFIEQQRVRKEQNLAEVRRKIEDGKKALQAKDAERAEKLFSEASDMAKLNPEFDESVRKEAADLLRQATENRRALETARDAELRAKTQEVALQEQDAAERVKTAQVQELLRKSAELLRQRDFEKVVEACERVLRLDPENRVAKFWIADAKDQIVQERRTKLIQARVQNNKLTDENFASSLISKDQPFEFPRDSEWAIVQGRAKGLVAVDTADPESIRRIKAALNTSVSFTFDKTPLNEVVQQLRTVTGAKIGIDPAVDGNAVQVSGTYQNLPATNVLNLVLESVGLSYTYKEGILFISQAGAKGESLVFGIYNVSDILNKVRDFVGPALLLRPAGDSGDSPISFQNALPEEDAVLDPEKLQELIKSSTGGDEAWGGEGVTLEYHGGQLLINAPRDLHASIQTVLENLRKDSDLFVVIEARFIDVNDDFLEDIGVDSRALGLANNYGTPFGNVINDGRTGGQDLGFVKQGSPVRDVTLIMGQDRWAGRIRHIIDGFTGTIRGERLTGGQGIGGLTLQATFLEPFQINTILRAVQERLNVRQLTAPVVTAHNGQRVFVSVITQRAYIADYNLVSGGTGFAIIEVADPEVQTFQEGVILDVDPVISHDKKYVTLDVRPTLATLIGGVISTILISLGSFTNVANQVPIGVPEISLQQSFTSVTVPNGGTVLLGGFKSLNETKFTSYLPILGKIPLIGNLFRRKSQLAEKRSLVILLTARIVDLREVEAKQFNAE